jgi:hypothetical protein
MSGYIRQSVADIINGANITAPPLNAEFNQLAAAFNGTTGHNHSGGTGEGPKIPLATSVSGFLPAVHGGVGGRNNNTAVTDPTNLDDANSGYAAGSFWINTSTGRVFLCVANAPNTAVWVEAVGILGGVISPQLTNTVDIGTNAFRFKDAFLSGSLTSASIVTGVASVDTLNVAVNATFTATPAFNAGITVNGASQLNGNATITGNTQLGDATSDTINLVGRVSSSIVPNTTNTRDLGSSTLRFRDIWGAGLSTLASLTANGTINFSGATVSNLGNVSTANISGGTINNTSIGATTASTVRGTTITATSGFSGPLTGNVTGNVTGNLTGAVTGNVTGNLTGNVTSSGTSTFNSVTVNGNIDMTAGGTNTVVNVPTPVNNGDVTNKSYVDTQDALKLNLTGGTMTGAIAMSNNKITSLGAPTNNADAATKSYVDSSIADLVNSAPEALDTLEELAAALGNDPDFATTVMNEIGTKVAKAGDTMTGPLAMSNQKVTSVGAPTDGGDAANKTYVDNQDALKVSKTGDSMSGNLFMDGNKVTGLGTPTDAGDATSKDYIDTLFGSTQSAADSAAAALISEQNAADSADAAALSFDEFDDRYLGAKASDPVVDNDGDPLVTGALYFDATNGVMKVYNGVDWQAASSSIEGIKGDFLYTATAAQTEFSGLDTRGNLLVIDQAKLVNVFLNGVRQLQDTDYTVSASNNSVTFTDPLALNDEVEIEVFGNFAGQSGAEVSITGGAINGTTIGDTTPSTGAFTNLSYTGTLTGSTGEMNIGSGQLVKDASGNVLIGSSTFVTGAFNTASRLQINGQTGSTSSFQATTWMPAATTAGQLVLQKSRGAAIGTRGVVLNNDFLGRIFFGGDDGTNFIPGASIDALVDGTPGTNAMPGRISFSTTPSGSNNPSERMRITSTGNVGIGTTSPGSALQVQGLITGTAVTQSQTDTTANRLLKYGDFGLGSTTLPIITEAQLESSYPTGFARVASTTDNERPFNFGSILSLSYDSPANRQTQLAIGNSDRRLAFRGTQAGRDWNYVYHTNNILSTVSQSGGVPTGGIIEQGSNANGEFVKYADGTQICYVRQSGTSDVTRVRGELFQSQSDIDWSYPASFINPATEVAVTAFGASTEDWLNLRAFRADNRISYRIMSPFSVSTQGYATALIAIGRWF